MRALTGRRRARRGPHAGSGTGASARQTVTDDDKPRPTGSAAEPTSDHDYFTNAVPLRGDRELREHQERMLRLERARRRRRAPRIRTGAVVAAAVVLAAGGLFFLARSPDHQVSELPSSQSTKPAATPHHTPAPKIGVARAVAVSVPRRRPDRARPPDARRPHRKEGATPETEEEEAGAPGEVMSAPEVVEAELTDEPQQGVDAEPESQAAPAPEPEPSPPNAPPKASGPTSSSEADRQFGFGR